MKLKTTLLAALFAVLSLTACTQNSRAKGWGGTATVDLPANAKLVTATWKDSQLWYLTRPMRKDEVAETLTLTEESSYGVLEGEVIFKESKQ